MNLILIQNKKNLNLTDLYNWNHIIEVRPGEVQFTKNPAGVQDLNPEFEACIEELERQTDFDGIVISFWLTDKPYKSEDLAKYFNEEAKIHYSALQLALYVRLSKFADIHHSPIIILTPCSEDQIILKSPKPFNILTAKHGTQLIELEKLNWSIDSNNDDNDDPLAPPNWDVKRPEFQIQKFIRENTCNKIKGKFSEFTSRVNVQNESTDNHSIANLWGPYQMAKSMGESIDFQTNLYFRYSLRRITNWDENAESKFSEKKLEGFSGKVLLIDDMHELGWKQVLELIFGSGNVICEKGLTEEILTQVESSVFSLIFLDYRFKQSNGTVTAEGSKFLTDIKSKNPVVPVIMFTASNKAWNMNELYEAGADGYFIKEHPDTADDPDFSIKNYENFIETVENCLEKGALLKPYWRSLTRIESEFKKENSLIQEKQLSDGNASNFKGRIKERITMFIGLLKKAFEQTVFDEKAFLYSEYELAFLTLWSVLNEFEEAYFKKIQGMEQEQGIPDSFRLFHNDENQTPLVSHWYFKETIKYLEYVNPNSGGMLVQDFNGFFDLKPFSSFYHRDWEVKNGDTRIIKWNMQISKHILFLIQKIKPSVPRSLLSKLSLNIIELNKVRNKLYLTHGGHANSPDYSDLYENTRESKEFWKAKIEDLFSIVYFLCTAEEWNHRN